MTKIQRDLLAACYNKKIDAVYTNVQSYAANYRKYDRLSIRQVSDVFWKLKELYANETTKV